MSIAIVLTALNNQETLIESIESVYSQQSLPDQIGVSLGPSTDDTNEFVQFYEDEVDFVKHTNQTRTAERGRSELRLNVLPTIETDYVLFLPAECFLYPQSIHTIRGTTENSEITIGSVQFLRDGRKPYQWNPPSNLKPKPLLEVSPIPPAAIAWSTSLLRQHEESLRTQKLGPFSTLGWLLQCSKHVQDFTVFDDPIIESWNFTEGEYCWTREAFSSLYRVDALMKQLPHMDSSPVHEWIRSIDFNDIPPNTDRIPAEWKSTIRSQSESAQSNWDHEIDMSFSE